MAPMTSRSRRARRRRRPYALTGAVAGFVLLCGLGLILFSGETSADGPGVSDDGEGLAREALTHTHMAERALDAENYGRARVHLREARQSLLSLLTGSASEQTTNEHPPEWKENE